jgi:hypothetical protein
MINFSSWNWKFALGAIVTALVVVAIFPKLIDFAIGVLGALKGLIPS